MADFRTTPERLVVGPVTSHCGCMQDAEGNHILDVRVYERLQYMENGDALQDKIEAWLVEAVNEKLAKDPI